MTDLDHLARSIQHETEALAASAPGNTEEAVHALLRARRSQNLAYASSRSAIMGVGLSQPGLDLALRFILESDQPAIEFDDADAWAAEYLAACNVLADAMTVAAHVETGFIHLEAPDATGVIHGWRTTDRAPARWREVAAWIRWGKWSNAVAEIERPADTTQMLSYQFGYPSESTLFGAKAHDWTRIAGTLFDLAEGVEADPISVEFDKLVTFVATRIKAKPELIEQRLPLFMLDRENAAWHATPPTLAAPPLIRVRGDRVVISPHGIWMAPLMFLTREMRRRDATLYHNAAQAKEDLFRREVYDLFPESRFVKARSRVLLRKPEGEARTDIDAAIFDKKTGTLAIFELKSLDPFARSTEEFHRQRDNMLEADQQVSAILQWIKAHSADEVLKRFDPGTAKKFQVARVLPFVLGRCLARYDNGPAPSAAAVWSDWPGFAETAIRTFDTQTGNPLASLHTALSQQQIPSITLPPDVTDHRISLLHSGYDVTIQNSPTDRRDVET